MFYERLFPLPSYPLRERIYNKTPLDNGVVHTTDRDVMIQRAWLSTNNNSTCTRSRVK